MNYYKSFNEELQGKNSYQFEINCIHHVDHTDTWTWFHFAQYVSSTLIYQREAKKIRICMVEPLGNIKKFPARDDGYNRGYYFTTNKIKIYQELTNDEIITKLIAEKCDFRYLLEYTNPSFGYLLSEKKKIRGHYICSLISKREDLSLDEKYELLPRSQHKYFFV